MRWTSRVRYLLLMTVALAMITALWVPTVDACARCALNLCIEAAYDGAASCREVLFFYGGITVTGCELSGTCTYEGGGSGGPCQPSGCEPDQPL